MPKSFALVVVKNGLGHLRRQLHFYEYLVKYGYTVKLFCHLPDLVRIGAKNINADELEIEVIDLPELVKTQFFEGLKSRLKTYDVVVSDNCIEILRRDAVIFASFLWHLSMDSEDCIRASKTIA